MLMQRIRAGWDGLLLMAFVAAGAGAAQDPCAEASARIKKRVCVTDVPSGLAIRVPTSCWTPNGRCFPMGASQ